MRTIAVNYENEGQRLDRLLLKYLNKAPKSFVYKMLRKKNIKLNNSKAEGSEHLKSGDEIEIYLSEAALEKFMSAAKIDRAGELDIIYEDEAVLIINKPPMSAVQRDKRHTRDTVNDRVLYYLYKKGEYSPTKENVFTPSICNRLDFNTAGIVTAGKSAEALRELNRAFRDKSVDKYYIAVVVGELERGGTIEGYQTKGENNISTLSSKKTEGSSYVCTHYKPLKRSKGYTLVEIKLETGKSHQIRVALSSINHPVIGDGKYGDRNVNKFFYDKFGLEGQFLCCTRLEFKTDGALEYLNNHCFEAKLPPKMYKIFISFFNSY